jgi:hypothetical protein
MRSRSRRKPSYADVVATLALFAALGGGAYAATQLPRNSVGPRQIRKNAVNSATVKNGSLRAADFGPGQLPSGPVGPSGPPGPQGATGEPGPFPDGSVPGGKTLRGTYLVSGWATASHQQFLSSVSFGGFTLAAAPAAHFVRFETAPPPQCPGSAENPQATRGNLCVYEAQETNQGAAPTIIDPATDEPGASRVGFAVHVEGTSSTGIYVDSYGTWAVNSP